MIWLAWRQHRAQAFGAVLLLAAAAAVFLPYGHAVHRAYGHDGVAACLAAGTGEDYCQNVMSAFMQQFNAVANHLLTWFTPLPGLLGGIVGATVLGPEYEHGTWRLAWTQATPRTRWLTGRVLLLAAGLTLATLALSLLIGWFRGPIDQVSGRFSPGAFGLEGLTLTGYTLFSFAAGVIAGQVLRRTVPAIVAAFAAYLALRIPVEFWLRPHYLAPVTRLASTASPTIGPMSTPISPGAPDWILRRDLVDNAGHPLSATLHDQVTQHLAGLNGPAAGQAYLHGIGVQYRILYQPADRFWAFQGIETTLFVGLAVLLVGAAIWRLRKRSI